jgi:hypothetical protein
VETTMVDVYVTHARAYKQVPVRIGEQPPPEPMPPLPPVRARQYTLIDLEVEWQEHEEAAPLDPFDPLDRAPPSEGLRSRGWGSEDV